MFKRYKYSIEDGSITLYPWHMLLLVGLMLCALFLVMGGGVLFLAAERSAYIFGISSLISLVIVVLFCLPFILFSQRKIIFEEFTETIYKQSWLGKKTIMTFPEVAEISAMQRMGYFLKPKGDRYGKGIYLAPGSWKKQNEFDKIVLPALNKMLATTKAAVPQQDNTTLYKAGQFDYYKPDGDLYVVKNTYIKQYWIGMIVIPIVWAILIYNSINKGFTDDAESYWVYLPAIPFIFLLATLTKKVYFDTAAKEFIVKYFGITWSKEDLKNFVNFKVTRKTNRGMHAGTDVRLLFTMPNGKQKPSSVLYDFKKTKKIEDFIAETRFIINTINKY